MHIVEKTCDGRFYEVAVNSSYIEWLRSLGAQLESYSKCVQRDVVVTSEEVEAIKKANHEFTRNAVERILYKRGSGLDQYYRNHIKDEKRRMLIEWAIVIRDIVVCSLLQCGSGLLTVIKTSESLDRFLQRCVFLGLALLGGFDSSSALTLIERDRGSWIEHFLALCMRKVAQPSDCPKGEMHDVSMLHGVLRSVSSKADNFQWRFDPDHSANDSLRRFGYLLNISGAASLGSFDTQRMCEAVSRAKVSGDEVLDIKKLAKLSEQICRYLPVRYIVPAELSNNIKYREVQAAHIFM